LSISAWHWQTCMVNKCYHQSSSIFHLLWTRLFAKKGNATDRRGVKYKKNIIKTEVTVNT